MREVLAVARGEAVPHAVHERDVRPIADTIQKPKHKDRHKPGYMAAYLRKWRRGEVGNKYKKEIGK